MRILSNKTVLRLLLLCNAVLLLVLATEIGTRFLYEVSGAFNGDSPVYWAVGRGLVNGYGLYRDLFDIKPPGMFLVSAFSLKTTGTMFIGHVLQGLVLALLPLTMLVPYFVRSRAIPSECRLFGWLLWIAFAGCITLYVALHSGEFQTESFGVFFVCTYIAVAILLRDRYSILLTTGAGIAFFGGILFKEPFLIAAIVSGLLLCRTRYDIVRMVILPCVIGLLCFALTLVVMGAFDDYTNIYLPFMTGDRTHRFGSPFSRAMLLESVGVSLWRFSPFFLLSMIFLWCSALFQSSRIHRGDGRRSMLCILFIVGLAMLNYGAQTVRLYSSHARRWYMDQSPGWMFVGLIVIVCAWYALLRNVVDKKTMTMRILLMVSALGASGYLAGLSGEFLGHHMIFVVPIYVALATRFIEDITLSERSFPMAGAVMGLLLILTVFMHSAMDYEKRRTEWTAEAALDNALALYIDRVLDACNEKQYLIVGETGTNVFGFTKHSPLGPIFFQQTLINAYPPFTLAFVDQLTKAEIILAPKVLKRTSLPGVEEYVAHDFSPVPRACATSIVIPDEAKTLQLLFRVSRSELELNVTADGKAQLAFTPEPKVESR